MIAIFDFIPKYCPNCGLPTLVRSDPVNLAEFSSHLSFFCSYCELVFQKAHTNEILRAAQTSGGDLHHLARGKKGPH
jgi:hypothetical protein